MYGGSGGGGGGWGRGVEVVSKLRWEREGGEEREIRWKDGESRERLRFQSQRWKKCGSFVVARRNRGGINYAAAIRKVLGLAISLHGGENRVRTALEQPTASRAVPDTTTKHDGS